MSNQGRRLSRLGSSHPHTNRPSEKETEARGLLLAPFVTLTVALGPMANNTERVQPRVDGLSPASPRLPSATCLPSPPRHPYRYRFTPLRQWWSWWSFLRMDGSINIYLAGGWRVVCNVSALAEAPGDASAASSHSDDRGRYVVTKHRTHVCY